MMRRAAPVCWLVCALWLLFAISGARASTPDPEMRWTLAPGESVAELASLIYPHHPRMQRRFAAAMLELNRAEFAGLSANAVFAHPLDLRMPDLRALARQAPPLRLRLSRGLAVRQGAAVAPSATAAPELALALSRQLSVLENHNAVLKRQESVLLDRIAALEAQLQALAAELQRRPAPVAALRPTQAQTAQPAPLPEHKAARVARHVAPITVLPTLVWPLAIILGLATAGVLVYRRRAIRVTAMPLTATPVSTAPGKPAPEAAIVTADGIAALVEEARVMAAVGRTERGVELLTAYLDTYPSDSIQPWLALLDLQRMLGDRVAFSQTGKRMHQIFNVMPPAWEGNVAMVVPTSLEAFPHIMQKLVESWGTSACRDYLDTLLRDNRNGERTGFSIEVLNEILLLLAILDQRD